MLVGSSLLKGVCLMKWSIKNVFCVFAEGCLFDEVIDKDCVLCNVELAEVASRYLLDLDPKISGYYLLLSHVLADSEQWRSVRWIRHLTKDRGVHKVPGCSWICGHQHLSYVLCCRWKSPRVASDLFLTEESAPRAKKRRLCSSSCTNSFFGNDWIWRIRHA